MSATHIQFAVQIHFNTNVNKHQAHETQFYLSILAVCLDPLSQHSSGEEQVYTMALDLTMCALISCHELTPVRRNSHTIETFGEHG